MDTDGITAGVPLTGVLLHDGRPAGRIFDPAASADGINEKWIALREGFRAARCELLAEDDLGSRAADFEIHVNVRTPRGSAVTFAILAECGLVYPPNADPRRLGQYRRTYAWDPELVETGIATGIRLAHPLGAGRVDGYASRSQLIVLIAANKALPVWRPQFDLYRERVRTIRWLERHAPGDFVLYGYGWDRSARLPTPIGGIVHRLECLLPWRPNRFPSWDGMVKSKQDVLIGSRFSIVYENVRGLRGYITEKIFDAFCAGNVPVYWGAEDIADHVPPNCFIDRRTFPGCGELYGFLRGMPEDTYLGYQRAIRDFLASDAARSFSTERFAKVIVSDVLARLVKVR